jgi:hypothetical protein
MVHLGSCSCYCYCSWSRVGEITGAKMAEYRVNTGYLPYGNFYVEMYQVMTSYQSHVYFSKMAGKGTTRTTVDNLAGTAT